MQPIVSPDQYAEITYDQDPGASSWVGVATRIQGPTNGSCYLAFAYNGQVQFWRADDFGGLSWTKLASANAAVGMAPRRLRLVSQGSTHQVYFNGALILTYTATSGPVYTTGQPGIAISGTAAKILSFTGGALAN